MDLVKVGMSVALAGALAGVGGQLVLRAEVSVQDALSRVQAGDVRPVMALLMRPHAHPAGPILGDQHRAPAPGHGSKPPAAEMRQTVGDVARFAGFLIGAGPVMLVEEFTLTRQHAQPRRM